MRGMMCVLRQPELTRRMTRIACIALLACAAGFCTPAHAETISVPAVLGSDPGKPGPIPVSLIKFRIALAGCAFTKFSDAGVQSVNVSAASPKAAAKVGAF